MKRILLIMIFLPLINYSQNAKQIVQRANDLVMGETSQGMFRMTLVRPDWTREVTMKIWSRGNDFYMIYITSPAREKGQVFMKRYNEMWNWVPSIKKMIKIPPSMMAQSWMGSDFTNDDLLKESSIVVDYTHSIIGEDTIDGYNCYKIELTPKPDAAVVWGKIVSWIAKDKYYQMKNEFFDEIGTLINTQFGSEIKEVGDRELPAKLTMIPADKPGNETILHIMDMEYDKNIPESFFSQQNMKRIK